MGTTEQENEFLDQIDSAHGMLRKLMSADEIKIANSLAKRGLLYKGISDDKQRTVVFYKY